ncbi:MAG: Wzz/FepE/Etk N-terminal domain-containing protein [Burkholderiales bacterium]
MISLPNRVDEEPPLNRDQSWDHEPGRFDLRAYVQLLWRNRVVLVGVTLLAAVLAVFVSFLMPRQYRAEATVFLTPPTYTTTLRPPVMAVEAYAQFAETQHILDTVDTELRRKHPQLFPAVRQTEGDRLATFAARLSASREPQKPYLPLVGLTATADTPEQAQAAANVWADVLVLEGSKLSEVGKSNASNFILHQYPKIQQALVESEKALQDLFATQARELAELQTEVGVSLLKSQLESSEWMVVQQEDALAAARTRLERLRPLVRQLEQEVKDTPQNFVVNKAITDEALWNAQSQTSRSSGALGDSALQTEEVNPVYVSLGQRLAEERVNLNALEPQIASLEKQLGSTRRHAVEVRRALLDGERRIADMQRRHEVEAAQLERAVDTARSAFDKIAEVVGEARLAQSEPDKDLKLGAYAGLPSAPSGPRRSIIVATVTLGASMLCALVVVVVDLIRRPAVERATRPPESPTFQA